MSFKSKIISLFGLDDEINRIVELRIKQLKESRDIANAISEAFRQLLNGEGPNSFFDEERNYVLSVIGRRAQTAGVNAASEVIEQFMRSEEVLDKIVERLHRKQLNFGSPIQPMFAQIGEPVEKPKKIRGQR